MMMMMAPQVVGVLLKKPEQRQETPRRLADPQDTKIRGELYVENLAERRFVSIRMGWLWVEGTPMRLALRALNLSQAPAGICQPHTLAYGFTLSNSMGDILATFWADTETIWWSWVRAIAAEIVRQTPFRAQRCLNFLEILTRCPRAAAEEPGSPLALRRRSRSELRCWPGVAEEPLGISVDSSSSSSSSATAAARRRARSELRGSTSSASSDEERANGAGVPVGGGLLVRTWGCSDGGSDGGSDDSLPWTPGPRAVDTVDAPVSILESTTREQRMQRYKEARRRENELRRRQVLEEDARRRRATRQAEEKTNLNNNNNVGSPDEAARKACRTRSKLLDEAIPVRIAPTTPERLPRLVKESPSPTTVRFETTRQSGEDNRNNNNNNSNHTRSAPSSKPGILKPECTERRSRARERRSARDKVSLPSLVSVSEPSRSREPTAPTSSKYPKIAEDRSPRTASLSVLRAPPCEEDVARLLKRCQRVDHYVPVRDKLTLFESLSRIGGRLARSTEDLGRSAAANPSPCGKQRARSLHDLNRGGGAGAKSLPVREICRFFENGQPAESPQLAKARSRCSDFTGTASGAREPFKYVGASYAK